eukprot:2224921-Ditylum_brightwellii.AAC.1
MSKYFGRPLMLRKAIYGLNLSGKLWVTEFSEWLLIQGFIQSKAEPAYFIMYKNEKTRPRLIFYVDDVLYFGRNEQMRIYQQNNGFYSLEQTRYTSNIIHKYNPKLAHGHTSTQNNPGPSWLCLLQREQTLIQEGGRCYKGKDFRSAVCSLLYLTFGTRGDILFITCKLAKGMFRSRH